MSTNNPYSRLSYVELREMEADIMKRLPMLKERVAHYRNPDAINANTYLNYYTASLREHLQAYADISKELIAREAEFLKQWPVEEVLYKMGVPLYYYPSGGKEIAIIMPADISLHSARSSFTGNHSLKQPYSLIYHGKWSHLNTTHNI